MADDPKHKIPNFTVDRWILLPLARLIFGTILFLCGPLRTRDKKKVPKHPGLLILSNHISDADPVAVQMACPRPIRYMAKSELFEMWSIRWALRAHGAFPVKRGEADRSSIKHAVTLLKAGEAVGVFPEGQLSEDGKLQELKPGIALIIRMAGVPVICAGVVGTDRVIPYGSTILRPAFRAMWVNWGEPKEFSKSDSEQTIMVWVEAELRTLTNQNRSPELRSDSLSS